MIPLERPPASERLTKLCDFRTRKIRTGGATTEVAAKEWQRAATAKSMIRELLEAMAPGVLRCMYCLDSRGTDIDHFAPKSRVPLWTFCWHNHLLACSHCNSNLKRDAYPCDSFGQCLLIDPTVEDPADHLRLDPITGEYQGCTPDGESSAKGVVSIRVFGLNRYELREGRRNAYIKCRELLSSWHRQFRCGDYQRAEEIALALCNEPFADVLRFLEWIGSQTYAAAALGDELATALAAWLSSVGPVFRGGVASRSVVPR
ncbi:hypothetical protein AB0O31_33935 [Kitasatospora cineracea]|uniref:hypothetical protein n=1 Tax=Kitasatospora cineracea TaxID=88074 RepID=UPI00343F78AF